MPAREKPVGRPDAPLCCVRRHAHGTGLRVRCGFGLLHRRRHTGQQQTHQACQADRRFRRAAPLQQPAGAGFSGARGHGADGGGVRCACAQWLHLRRTRARARAPGGGRTLWRRSSRSARAAAPFDMVSPVRRRAGQARVRAGLRHVGVRADTRALPSPARRNGNIRLNAVGFCYTRSRLTAPRTKPEKAQARDRRRCRQSRS